MSPMFPRPIRSLRLWLLQILLMYPNVHSTIFRVARYARSEPAWRLVVWCALTVVSLGIWAMVIWLFWRMLRHAKVS